MSSTQQIAYAQFQGGPLGAAISKEIKVEAYNCDMYSGYVVFALRKNEIDSSVLEALITASITARNTGTPLCHSYAVAIRDDLINQVLQASGVGVSTKAVSGQEPKVIPGSVTIDKDQGLVRIAFYQAQYATTIKADAILDAKGSLVDIGVQASNEFGPVQKEDVQKYKDDFPVIEMVDKIARSVK